MKKNFILIYLPFILMLSLIAIAYKPITIHINNKPIQFSINPIIVENSIMVPVLDIAKAFKADVSISKDNNTICIFKNNHILEFHIMSNKYLLNGLEYPLKSTPLNIDGKHMVPLLPITQCFDAKISSIKKKHNLIIHIS